MPFLGEDLIIYSFISDFSNVFRIT